MQTQIFLQVPGVVCPLNSLNSKMYRSDVGGTDKVTIPLLPFRQWPSINSVGYLLTDLGTSSSIHTLECSGCGPWTPRCRIVMKFIITGFHCPPTQCPSMCCPPEDGDL